ncbi:hypothetical protein MPER_06665 [Moniliophthora perniciosa FA553]|nr:hypothetical protein MPER_06665 [Moniliophthora perniciosa FA553]
MSLFKIAISDQALDHLKQKLQVARLPDEIDDASRRHTEKDGYDWRKHEKMLNDALPHFTMDIEVEGRGILNIHYIYDVANAIPLLLFVHGWPGSFLEVRKILPLLASGTPSFHVVALGLPGYGFSEGTKMKGFDLSKYTEVGHRLMLALGYSEYGIFPAHSFRRLSSSYFMTVTQGGDWGHAITRNMAVTYGGQHIKAWHTNTLVYNTPPKILKSRLGGSARYTMKRSGLYN